MGKGCGFNLQHCKTNGWGDGPMVRCLLWAQKNVISDSPLTYKAGHCSANPWPYHWKWGDSMVWGSWESFWPARLAKTVSFRSNDRSTLTQDNRERQKGGTKAFTWQPKPCPFSLFHTFSVQMVKSCDFTLITYAKLWPLHYNCSSKPAWLITTWSPKSCCLSHE